MLTTETIVPVYFAIEDDELLSIYTQTLTSSSSQGSLSAAEGSRPSTAVLHLPQKEPCRRIVTSVFYFDSAAAYSHG